VNLVLLPRFAELSGYTEKAIRRKIEEGIWLEGREYVKAPDRHILIDIAKVEKWARGESVQ
jgi:hypothetical protein